MRRNKSGYLRLRAAAHVQLLGIHLLSLRCERRRKRQRKRIAEAADVGSGGRPGGMRHAVLLFACMLLLWWSVRRAARGVAIVMSDFGGAQKPMKSGLNSQQMHARTIARSGFGGDTVLRVQTWGR